MLLTSVSIGTTSACAENTYTEQIVPIILRNYLRVRGEYATTETQTRFLLELPPRARRILHPATFLSAKLRTTSACAENMLLRYGGRCPTWNYLRVRGEYDSISDAELLEQELPPRARRILIVVGE